MFQFVNVQLDGGHSNSTYIEKYNIDGGNSGPILGNFDGGDSNTLRGNDIDGGGS